MKKIRIKATFLQKVLGSNPASPEVYSDYIASKSPAPNNEGDKLAVEALESNEKPDRTGITVFLKDPKTGVPYLRDYLVLGFFKAACSALQRMKGEACAAESSKLKAFKKVIDGCINVYPMNIPFEDYGEIAVCERPLRAQTMQGERVALAASEVIPEGSTITFEVVCPNIYEAVIYEWLNYGKTRGLGQWRNAGNGRFSYEVLSVETLP